MIDVKLSDGFKIEIAEENLDDFELLEDLAAIDGAKDDVPMSEVISATKRLLGENQYGELKEYLRNDAGIVPATSMLESIQEILFGLNENPESKN